MHMRNIKNDAIKTIQNNNIIIAELKNNIMLRQQ